MYLVLVVVLLYLVLVFVLLDLTLTLLTTTWTQTPTLTLYFQTQRVGVIRKGVLRGWGGPPLGPPLGPTYARRPFEDPLVYTVNLQSKRTSDRLVTDTAATHMTTDFT